MVDSKVTDFLYMSWFYSGSGGLAGKNANPEASEKYRQFEYGVLS